LLLERGFALGFAGGAMGMLGLMALPGRLIFTPLGSRWARSTVTASIFGLQAVACAVLLASRQTAAVWLFVALFGAGFGAITPARAALIAELYGPAHYGRISGYDVVVAALLALSLGSASAVMAVRRGSSAFAAPATPVSGVP
jgi:hypothetical protein